MVNNESKIHFPDDPLNNDLINLGSIFAKLFIAAKKAPVKTRNIHEDIIEQLPMKKFHGKMVPVKFLCYIEDKLAAVEVILPYGTIVKNHTHGENECYEFLYCISGHAITNIRFKNDRHVIQEIFSGGFSVVPPGCEHSTICVEETDMICITTPPDPDYPKSEKFLEVLDGNIQ